MMRDGTRTSKDDDDCFCQDTIGRINAPAHALPLPSPQSATSSMTSLKGGGRTPKNHDKDDSRDACQKPFNLEGVDFNVDSRCKVILDLLIENIK